MNHINPHEYSKFLAQDKHEINTTWMTPKELNDALRDSIQALENEIILKEIAEALKTEK